MGNTSNYEQNVIKTIFNKLNQIEDFIASRDNHSKFEFYSVKELCELLNLKESMVRKLVFKKEIPFFKVGGSIRFSKASIIQWLESLPNQDTLKN